jgi:uncharacterized damage-inducible protein DinB
MEKLQYPIGKFHYEGTITAEQRDIWIKEITEAPQNLRLAVQGLSENQLDTPYRPEGWTVRQVVHHVADSHMNSYIRFKLALTEVLPTIKPYDEASWAELSDSVNLPIEISLQLLDSLHLRWVDLLRSTSAEAFNRSFIHPVSGETTLAKSLGNYAWHGNHHIAHITSLRDRMGWKYSKRDLLEQFKAWLLLVNQLKSLDERKWITPIREGKWSIRDVVCHIMLWDRFFHEGAIANISSDSPLTLTMKDVNFDQFNKNAITYAKSRQKDDILAQAEAIRSKIITKLEQMTDAQFHIEYIDGDGHPFVIYEYLLDFIGHDRHHMKQIHLN